MRNNVSKDTYAMMFREYPDIVDVSQMSEMLHISTKTAYKLLRENKVEYFVIGRNYKIPKINIISFLNLPQNTAVYSVVGQ